MKCSHCNGEHPDDFKFCPKTGKRIELKACTNEECPEFGKHVLPLDANYCPECGHKIASECSDERLNVANEEEVQDDGLYESDSNYLDCESHEYDYLFHPFSISGISIGEYNSKYTDYEWEPNRNGGYKTVVDSVEVNTDVCGEITSFFSKSVPDSLCQYIGCGNYETVSEWLNFFSGNYLCEYCQFGNYVESDFEDHGITLCMQFKSDETLRYIVIKKFIDRTYYRKICMPDAIRLGKVTINSLKNKHTVYRNENGECCAIDGVKYIQDDFAGSINKIVYTRNSELPSELIELGITWDECYSRLFNIVDNVFSVTSKELPKVVSKKGRNVFVAKIECSMDDILSMKMLFDMGNTNGEGYSPTSYRTLDSIIIELNGFDV